MSKNSHNTDPRNRQALQIHELQENFKLVAVAFNKKVERDNQGFETINSHVIQTNVNLIEIKAVLSQLENRQRRSEIMGEVVGRILVRKGICENDEEVKRIIDEEIFEKLGIDQNGTMIGRVEVCEYNLSKINLVEAL